MDKNEFMFGLETEEEKQSYLDNVEKEARRVLERDEMMKENFERYFMSYFPGYLANHGPWQILKMISMDDLKEHMKDETVPEIAEAIRKMDEEKERIKSEQERLSALIEECERRQIFQHAVFEIADADREDVSDEEFREKVRELYDDAIDRDNEMDLEEYEEIIAEAEEEYRAEMEAERLMILEEADNVYRNSQF